MITETFTLFVAATSCIVGLWAILQSTMLNTRGLGAILLFKVLPMAVGVMMILQGAVIFLDSQGIADFTPALERAESALTSPTD